MSQIRTLTNVSCVLVCLVYCPTKSALISIVSACCQQWSMFTARTTMVSYPQIVRHNIIETLYCNLYLLKHCIVLYIQNCFWIQNTEAVLSAHMQQFRAGSSTMLWCKFISNNFSRSYAFLSVWPANVMIYLTTKCQCTVVVDILYDCQVSENY